MRIAFPNLCGLAILVLMLAGRVDYLIAEDLNARVMISGGGSFILDRNVRDSAGTPYLADFKDRLQGGFLIGIDLYAPLALEAGFRAGSSGLRAKGEDSVPKSDSLDFGVQQFFCNAVYSTPYSDGGLRLFATGGIGLRRIAPDSGIDSDIGWSVNFGGGLEARTSRRFSIRVELRDFVGAMPHLVPSRPAHGFVHDIQPSIGLIIHLR